MAKLTKICKTNEARHRTITVKARLSFPALFTPRSFQDDENQKKSYSADLIFDSAEDFKKDHKGAKKQFVSPAKAVFNAKVDQWGADQKKWPKMEYPVFKKGDDRTNKDGEVYEGYEGKMFLTAKSGEKFPPKVVDKYGKALSENEINGGDYVKADLLARPYSFGKNNGVRFILLGIQLVEKGERFGGMSTDAFDVSEEADGLEGDGGEDFSEGDDDGSENF